jgi:hypothetical protein
VPAAWQTTSLRNRRAQVTTCQTHEEVRADVTQLVEQRFRNYLCLITANSHEIHGNGSTTGGRHRIRRTELFVQPLRSSPREDGLKNRGPSSLSNTFWDSRLIPTFSGVRTIRSQDAVRERSSMLMLRFSRIATDSPAHYVMRRLGVPIQTIVVSRIDVDGDRDQLRFDVEKRVTDSLCDPVARPSR